MTDEQIGRFVLIGEKIFLKGKKVSFPRARIHSVRQCFAVSLFSPGTFLKYFFLLGGVGKEKNPPVESYTVTNFQTLSTPALRRLNRPFELGYLSRKEAKLA